MTTALSSLRQMIGRLLGAGDVALVTGTPTGGFSTTGLSASALGIYETNFFNNWNLRFYAGTHKDVSRIVSAFTTSTGAMTWSGALSGGAADATDLFELHRDYTAEEINSAINLAINMVEDEALVDKVDETLVCNDLLTDGLFETWTDSSNLTNWTTGGTGTLARESNIKREGTYSAKLTNTVSNAFSIQQSITNYGLYAGKTATLIARVNCGTANRVRIRLTDGVTTWNSDYHDGSGWLEGASVPYLRIEGITIGSTATELTASFRIETGAAISAYVDKMWLVSGPQISEYTIPSGFYTIEEVYKEGNVVGDFSQRINGKLWQILGTSTKKLWINPDKVYLTNGRKLRLVGQSLASQLTLDADTTPIPAFFLVQQAAAILHQSRISGADSVSQRHEKQMTVAQALADRERPGLFVVRRGLKV